MYKRQVFGVGYEEARDEAVYVNDYGEGRSVFSLYPYAREYFWAAAPTWEGGDPARAEEVRRAFLEEMWEPAGVVSLLTTDAPQGVILLPYRRPGEVALRAINLVGVEEGDAVPRPQRGLTVELALPAEAVAARRLEFLGRWQDQPFRQPAPDWIEVSFNLEILAVLRFTTNAGPCELFGDFNCDCRVGVDDIQQVAGCWHTTETDPNWDARYDVDNDGDVDVVDIMLVAAHWGDACGP